MTFIARMQATIDKQRAKEIQCELRIIEFRSHLRSPEFDSELGGDTISTADVNRWLHYIGEPLAE
jgi:hypothetical protein